MNLQRLSSIFLLVLACVVDGKPQYRLRQSASHVERPTTLLKLKKRRGVQKLCGKSGKAGKSGKTGKSGKAGRRRSLEDVCDDDYYFGDDAAKTFPPLDGAPVAGGSTFDDDNLIEPAAPLTGEDPLVPAEPVARDDDDFIVVEDDGVAREDDALAPTTDDSDDNADDIVDDGFEDGDTVAVDDDISISNEDLGISGFPDDDISISNEELVQNDNDDEVSNDPLM